MATTTEQYLNLIPSANRTKPKFVATVTLNVAVSVRIQNLFEAMRTTLFDLDLAVGDQLDIIGKWAGISRHVNIPVTGLYFTWDGELSEGWDYGIWKSPLAGNITLLPDEQYRTLIKAKIAANQWDGTTEGAYTIWENLFSNFTILIIDYQNMSYSMAFVGAILDSLTLALIQGGYIPLKPEGVRIYSYFIPITSDPLFAWDQDTDILQGWDTGYYAKEVFET
jgi:hypothetical protein